MSRESVLFVDDDPAILGAIRRLLLDEPYEVRACEDPVEALRQVVASPPTVVVSDYYMPPMNGPAFLLEVRRVAPSAVRMILTGKPDLGAVVTAVQEGAVHKFLIKPWDDADLIRTVREALDYRRLLDEQLGVMAEISRRAGGS
ncbi:MAG: response regulator [Planctomycetes bacterium]|nr:response regulator [Planctomycetota bacterium]